MQWNQQKLPDWAVSSSIIGLQGGTDRVLQVYNVMKDAGVEKINGIWIQDWSGQIVTDFGKRVFWNWKWDEDRYPGLDKVIKDLKEKDDTLFLVYMNPHLNVLGDLFVKAENDGALIKYHNEVTGETETFKQDFGEFLCGTVDLTSSHGRNWYRDNIINPALDLGIRGWMADFGEYLPLDENIILADGRKAKQVHNDFPALWAQVNYEAIDAYGLNSEDVFLFYRAGYTNSNKYAQSAWAGDQTVDWSESDGLASTIPAALSLGASGLSVTHIDIGLYTSLVGQEVDGYKFKHSCEKPGIAKLNSCEKHAKIWAPSFIELFYLNQKFTQFLFELVANDSNFKHALSHDSVYCNPLQGIVAEVCGNGSFQPGDENSRRQPTRRELAGVPR